MATFYEMIIIHPTPLQKFRSVRGRDDVDHDLEEG